MKKLIYLAVMLFVIAGCIQKKEKISNGDAEDAEVSDSTIYGICDKGTMMHTLELITNMQDTLEIHINDEYSNDQTLVAGGLMCGDRMAVTAHKTEEGWVAQRVLNLTSLLGKWASIDKSFEITEDGEVKSHVKIESNSWTSWRILNGQLLLNRDTFDIVGISADSLQIENREGLFAYRRMIAVPEKKNKAKKDSIVKK